jgi:hypothetical protein
MSEKPKILLYRETLASIEQRIVDALPEIVEGVISRAKSGNAKAAMYLLDRIMGRATSLKSAPIEDQSVPYTEEDYRCDREQRDLINELSN